MVHADETSVRSGKASLWVYCVLHRDADPGACRTARQDHYRGRLPARAYTGTIVHDRLAGYFNYGRGHVLCNTHILRSLNELLANHRHQSWARAFFNLIVDTKRHVEVTRAGGHTQLSVWRRRKVRQRWDDLCEQAARAEPPLAPGWKLYGTDKDARNLAIALDEHRDLVLAYTTDLSVIG